MSTGNGATPHSTQLSVARKSDGAKLKVLYALDSYPQLSESYINAEIERMRSWGVDIEVWSSAAPASPIPTDVPVHRGELTTAIAKAKPDVVHTHWTKSAVRYKEAAAKMARPMTSRGHWHFIPKQIADLERDPTIVRLYMFPHLARRYGASSKILPMDSCFHPEWVAPATVKDRRLVVRTAACKKSKDLATFVRVASRLPEYRFIIILCSLGPNGHYRELEELNRSLGSPVLFIHDVSNDEVARYLAEAAIYLHTYDPDVSFGMPVSIAEAMVAGCTVLARDVDGAADYLGDAGRLYRTEEEAAALIQATAGWSEEEWEAAERTSRQRASSRFDDRTVLKPLLDTWLAIAGGGLGQQEKVSGFGRIKRWFGQ